MLPIPMHLHFHKDGLIFLRDFFAAALALGFIVLRVLGGFRRSICLASRARGGGLSSTR